MGIFGGNRNNILIISLVLSLPYNRNTTTPKCGNIYPDEWKGPNNYPLALNPVIPYFCPSQKSCRSKIQHESHRIF